MTFINGLFNLLLLLLHSIPPLPSPISLPSISTHLPPHSPPQPPLAVSDSDSFDELQLLQLLDVPPNPVPGEISDADDASDGIVFEVSSMLVDSSDFDRSQEEGSDSVVVDLVIESNAAVFGLQSSFGQDWTENELRAREERLEDWNTAARLLGTIEHDWLKLELYAKDDRVHDEEAILGLQESGMDQVSAEDELLGRDKGTARKFLRGI